VASVAAKEGKDGTELIGEINGYTGTFAIPLPPSVLRFFFNLPVKKLDSGRRIW
jgi:hypothetical protein